MLALTSRMLEILSRNVNLYFSLSEMYRVFYQGCLSSYNSCGGDALESCSYAFLKSVRDV